MAKYDKHKLPSHGVDVNSIDYDNVFIAIANELAESNRLKRIELREKLAIHRKIQFMVDETELDDRA